MLSLPKKVQELIEEYQACSKLNSFLAKELDCNKALQVIAKIDRWKFVDRCNAITRELKDYCVSMHGKRVIVRTKQDHAEYGTIIHHVTKEYDGKIRSNDASFMSTLSLWVDVDDNKFDSHCYGVDKITLVEE